MNDTNESSLSHQGSLSGKKFLPASSTPEMRSDVT